MNYDNTNRGVLFKNDNKASDNHPDYNGTINVAEDEYWLSAWVKTSKDGRKYFSLSVKPKQPRAVAPPKEEPKSVEFDDDLPF